VYISRTLLKFYKISEY